MMEIWPSRCAALAKRSLQYMFPFGLAAMLTGTVFVDRGNRERALGTMDNVAITIQQKKVCYRSSLCACVRVCVCVCV